MVAIDKGIVQELAPFHLVITVDGGVGDPVHDHQGAPETIPFQVIEVIIDGFIALVDDPDPPGMLLPVSEKEIAFRKIVVSMSIRKRTATFKEGIILVNIST